MISLELRAEHGRTVVLKRADPAVAADRSRLGREATMLAVAHHPGVVELADPPDDTDTTTADLSPAGDATAELRTIFAGTRTLAAADLDPSDALRALAAVATTLADLHGLGLVHGRVRADHVVLADSGRAVLCGFAEAGLAGDLRDDGAVLVPSLDVASLGALLSHHLDRSAEPGGGDRRPPVDHESLSLLAARATEADARLRPSARSFAAALDRALPRPRPDAPVGRRFGDGDPAPSGSAVGISDAGERVRPDRPMRLIGRHPRHRRRHVVAALGVTSAVASLGFGLNALTDAPGSAAPARQTPSAPPAESTSTIDPEPRAQPGGADVVIDGRRFVLGTPDDQVLHAVWGCGSVDTTVLVRPDGTVFHFGALAEPGREVQGIASGRLPPRAGVEVVHDDHGCAALQAHGPDGPVVLLIEPT